MAMYNYSGINPLAYQQPQPNWMMPPPRQNVQSNGVIWVNGLEGAKGYIVQPNSTVVLMDSEQNCFYLKSANEVGVPSIRIFEFKEKTQTTSAQSEVNLDEKLKNYVPRAEFDEIKNTLTNITNTINSMFNTNQEKEKPKYIEKGA